jgi:hypothetical protein
MNEKDGRRALSAYRVRVGSAWYWVDPTIPPGDLAPGDMVVIYPAAGAATLAILQSSYRHGEAASLDFSTLAGERFRIPASEIARLHLAAVDEEQT